GPEKSASFINWFQQVKNQEIVQRLLEEVNVTQASSQPQGKKCENLTFVITGEVYHYKNRNALKAYIESQGGRVAGSVSGSTNYLINNDITSTSGKNKKAKDLGIEIISEDTFIERFGNNEASTPIIEGSLF
ncbi:MAG: NAD-dependent DNA ligase LigA, partial [Prevotella sp.]|nr:NAD-dependent DNA ligase LigA [Prevotella sp.]